MTNCDCHVHIVLDGDDYKAAFARHSYGVDKPYVKKLLTQYSMAGIKKIRDGGDKFGVSQYASTIAADYGIKYLTPLYPIYKEGYYGKFIGKGFDSENEFIKLVQDVKNKGHFLKIFASGILDFANCGKFIYDEVPEKTVKEMIHVGHEEGLRVMVHCSGERDLEAAIEENADSIEHGFYINRDCMLEMASRDIIWVPTISTAGNLISDERYPKSEVQKIFNMHSKNIKDAAQIGVKIACGSDAGAYKVPHIKGAEDEYNYLCNILGDDAPKMLKNANDALFERFSERYID